MGTNNEQYIPALRYNWLTHLYDPVIAVTTREKTFKKRLIKQADIQKGHEVIDIGSGTGTLALWIKQNFILLIYILVCSGCQTTAQTQFNSAVTQANNTNKSFEVCANELKRSPVGKRIDEILILDINDSDAMKKMLIDRNTTEAEKNDLLEFQAGSQPCRKIGLEGYSTVHPAFVNLMAKWFAENDELLLKIIKDEITIGDANAVINNNYAKRNQEWTNVQVSITQQYQNNHQYEVQQRQAAIASLQQWNYQQQLLQQNQRLINAANRPTMTTTNCHYVGSFINCTTF